MVFIDGSSSSSFILLLPCFYGFLRRTPFALTIIELTHISSIHYYLFIVRGFFTQDYLLS
jgi:hypothetical protein